MTIKEQRTIDNLFKSVEDLKKENAMFREDVNLIVETLNTKVEKKHLPVIFEQDNLIT